jgi:hypothetical protein
MLLMCELNEKKKSLLYQNIFDQFHRLQYFYQLCQNGPIQIPVITTKKRILYRGKSGQVSGGGDTDEEKKESPEMMRSSPSQKNSESKQIQNSKRKNQYAQESPGKTRDEVTSSPPPSSSNWFERFNCFRKHAKISVIHTKFLELTSLKKPVGPHGRYCFCGCRQSL